MRNESPTINMMFHRAVQLKHDDTIVWKQDAFASSVDGHRVKTDDANAKNGVVRFMPPTLISTHLGRSDADTFFSGFPQDRNVVVGSTREGNRTVTVQSTDGGNTFAEAWPGGVGVGGCYGLINGSLQSVGNASRHVHPAVSEIDGSEYSVMHLDVDTKRVSIHQHCEHSCDTAHSISWSGFPAPTLSVTLYAGDIIPLYGGGFGKTMVACDAPSTPERPYGCSLTPRHENVTAAGQRSRVLLWGSSNLSVWWFRSDDGIHWRFASVVANSKSCQAQGIVTQEGP